MDTALKISVIVPVYNVEKYLEKCVYSICSQTYDNLEIILVDDGSTDCSGEICDHLADEDSRILVIHKQNGGLSSARNTGLDVAKGEYICFVDSDDFIDIRMYEIMLDACKEQNAEMAICNFLRVSEDETPCRNETDLGRAEPKVLERHFMQEELNRSSYMRDVLVVAWNKIYQRKMLEGIRFPLGRLHEDEATTFRLLYLSEKTVFIDAPLYYYLIRSGSITYQFQRKRFDLFDAYLDRLDFYYSREQYDLTRLVIFQYMHMLAQYMAWFEMSDPDNRQKVMEYHGRITSFLRKNKLAYGFRQNMEIRLFYHVHLYFKIWKTLKSFHSLR